MLLPLTEHHLEQQPWNGNLRVLANAVERACIMSAQEVIGPREFNTQDTSFAESNEELHLKEAIKRYKRTLLLKTLQLHRRRIAESAQSLGISRKSLWEKMRRYGMEAKNNQPPVRPFFRKSKIDGVCRQAK